MLRLADTDPRVTGTSKPSTYALPVIQGSSWAGAAFARVLGGFTDRRSTPGKLIDGDTTEIEELRRRIRRRADRLRSGTDVAYLELLMRRAADTSPRGRMASREP